MIWQGGERRAATPDPRRGLLFFAGGGIEGEPGAVDLDAEVPDVQRDALEDVGDRIRCPAVDFGAGGERVEGERLTHDRAGVEGAGHRRGDRDHVSGSPW